MFSVTECPQNVQVICNISPGKYSYLKRAAYQLLHPQVAVSPSILTCSQDCTCSDVIVDRCHHTPVAMAVHAQDMEECKDNCDVCSK